MQWSVIFDLDGTITDSEGIYQKLKYDVLADMGHVLTKEEINSFKEIPYYKFPNAYKEKFNVQLNEFEFFHFVNTRVRQAYHNDVKLKDGFLELLDYLDSKEIKYSIATAAKNINAIAILKRFNIYERFQHIVSTNDVGRPKKFPTIFKVTAMLMDTPFENTIVFEDSLIALTSAKNAGFKVVGVADVESKENWQEIKSISNYYVENFKDLLKDIHNKNNSLQSLVGGSNKD